MTSQPPLPRLVTTGRQGNQTETVTEAPLPAAITSARAPPQVAMTQAEGSLRVLVLHLLLSHHSRNPDPSPRPHTDFPQPRRPLRYPIPC